MTIPNAPKTPTRTIRVSNDLWTAVKDKAAIEEFEKANFDVVFLDEMMPGMTGLETLQQIKQLKPQIPVVMITKSEEEQLMDEAIGGKIADYLIKPLNPSQIWLSVKRILQNRQLVESKTTQNYQQEFRQIGQAQKHGFCFIEPFIFL